MMEVVAADKISQETVNIVIAMTSVIAVVLTWMIRLGIMNLLSEAIIYLLNILEVITISLAK